MYSLCDLEENSYEIFKCFTSLWKVPQYHYCEDLCMDFPNAVCSTFRSDKRNIISSGSTMSGFDEKYVIKSQVDACEVQGGYSI